MDLEGKRNSKTLKNIFKLKYFCLQHIVIETNVENIDEQEEANEASWKFTTRRRMVNMSGFPAHLFSTNA